MHFSYYFKHSGINLDATKAGSDHLSPKTNTERIATAANPPFLLLFLPLSFPTLGMKTQSALPVKKADGERRRFQS